jgi:type IV secretion system protein VirB9
MKLRLFCAGPAALTAIAASLLFSSCRTLHYDRGNEVAAEKGGFSSREEYEKAEEDFAKKLLVEEEMKTIDIAPTVVYIDRPVYSPLPPPADGDGPGEESPPRGAAAVLAAEGSARQIPLEYRGGIMYYPFDESFTYEIHTRPYRVTDVMLEPGEVVLEQPVMSENNVWEVAAGVSREGGLDVQRFFLKPSKTGLETDMVIITDRRVYHLHLKSFKDRHMVMVKWRYPFSPALNAGRAASGGYASSRNAQSLKTEDVLVDPAFLSFDYKLSYSIFKKPRWLPRRIYDDGAKTYIELDERVLHSETPALFNKKDERVNYRLKGKLMILDELVEKLTLRIGKESATIEKKRAK